MSEAGWKRDETPYYVFACWKCKQFMYAKTIQKTKKCPRCGRNHQVKTIKGEVVKGMTAANKRVIEKQNEFAKNKLGVDPDLRTFNDFCVTSNDSYKTQISNPKQIQNEIDYSETFKGILIKLSDMYKEFPDYMIEMMAMDYSIPNSEVRMLTEKNISQKFLICLKGNNYKVNKSIR